MTHYVPHILERRLRSPECRDGRTDCTDTTCLCACHEQTRDDDQLLRSIVAALDGAVWRPLRGAA